MQASKKITKNTFVYFAANIITKAAAYLLIPIYTIYLSPAEYGILNIIGIVSALLFIIIILGLKSAISRFTPEYPDRSSLQKKFLGNITCFVALTGIIAAFTLSYFGELIFGALFSDVPYFPFLFIAVWMSFFKLFKTLKLAIFQVRHQAVRYSVLEYGFILANIILTVVVVAFLKKGLSGKIWLDFILAALAALVSIVLLIKDIKPNLNFKEIAAPLKYSIPLIPHMLAGFLLSAIDRIFLEQLTDLSMVGIYSLAFNIALLIQMFTESVRLSYTPFFNETAIKQGKKANPAFARYTTYGFLLYTAAGVLLIVFSKEFITLFAADAYLKAYTLLPVIVFTNVINGLYFFFMRPLMFLKTHTKFVSAATILSAIINIILNYFLIIRFDMLGAAWATFAAVGIKVALVYYFAQKSYPIPYEIKRLSVLFGILLLSLGVFYIAEFADWSLTVAIPAKILFLAAIPVVLLRTHFLKKDEYQYFRNF